MSKPFIYTASELAIKGQSADSKSPAESLGSLYIFLALIVVHYHLFPFILLRNNVFYNVSSDDLDVPESTVSMLMSLGMDIFGTVFSCSLGRSTQGSHSVFRSRGVQPHGRAVEIFDAALFWPRHGRGCGCAAS